MNIPDTSVVKDASFNSLAVSDLAVSKLKVGTLTYPSSGPAGGVPTCDGKSLVFLSRLIAKASGAVGVVPDDHVQFDNVLHSIGSNITLDVVSPYTTALAVPSLGRITLQPGTYHIRGSVLEIGTTANNGVIEAALRNADSGAYFNSTGTLPGGTDRCLLTDEAVVTVSVATRLDLTFVFGTTLASYAKALIDVVQIS